MNRHDSFLADRSVTVETRDAKPWDRREFVKGVAALAGSAGLLGYDPRPAAAEPPPEITNIRLLHVASICLAPQYLAEELLHLEGFSEVEYVKLETGTGPPVIASGQADISMWDVPATILTMDAGKPLVMLAGIHAGCYELFAKEGIDSIRDLKGRRIAIQAFGGGDHVLISSMLAYVGMDPQKDVQWIAGSKMRDGMRLFVEGKGDAFMGFPPEPQELRARKIGRVLVNTTQDRPWSQYFCCAVWANKEFVAKYPVATKRTLRAFLKATEICANEPEKVARYLEAKGYETRYEVGLEVLKSLPYARWQQSNPEDTLRFHALRLHEVGMIKSSPQKLIAQGTDWRFLNELKKELKA